MEKLNKLVRWVYARARTSSQLSEGAAVVSRIVTGLFILALGLPYGSFMANIPDGLFQPSPFSITAVATGFPDTGFFLILEVICILSALAMVWGIRARWAGFAFVVAFFLLKSYLFSLGKIDHSVFLPVTVLCLSLTNAGCYAALVPDKPWKFTAIGPTLLAICLCFGMFTAGIPKLFYWVDFDLGTSGFLSWFNAGYFNQRQDIPLAELVFALPPFVLELMDYSATFLELIAFVCLIWSPRSWRGWLTVICLFHAANVLLLAINFKVHVVAYLPFLLTPLLLDFKVARSWLYTLGTVATLFVMYLLYQRFSVDLAPGAAFADPYSVIRPSLYATMLMWGIMVGLGVAAVLKSSTKSEAAG